jgi:hypothetical protein
MVDEKLLTWSNRRRRYMSLVIVFLLVVGVAVALAIRDRPPRPLIPATDTERRVLAIASRAIASTRVDDWKVAVTIAPGTKAGTFVVTYWTPRSVVQRAGPRLVIVNLEDETVEFPVHE